VWSGRRVAWWVAKGRHEFYSEITHATTPELQADLISLPLVDRSKIVSCLEGMRLGILEENRETFSFFDHVPYSALGVFYCTQGGSLSDARARLRRCIEEYDAHCPSGKGFHMHRVAHIIFSRLNPCRGSLEEFLHGDGPLENYSRAFVTLQEYCLTPMVTRLVESIHAMVKRAGKAMTYVKVPYLCSVIRERRNIELLRSDAAFSAMVLRDWHSRTLLDQVLSLRASASDLKSMTSNAKLGLVYQSSLEAHFAATDAGKACRALALDVRQRAYVSEPKMSDDTRAVVTYMKEMLVPGSFYSWSKDLFDVARGERPPLADVFHDDDPIADVLAASDQLGFEHSFLPGADGRIIFRVLHRKPEAILQT
jgi:hypothetical protein